MIQIGKTQKLHIETIASVGVYLDAGTKNPDDDILLPNNQVPQGAKEGDPLEVFIYRDSEDRLIATRKTPYAEVGELAYLQVIENTKIGSFLDWGLEKDLFLPFNEQKYPILEGKKYLVAVYLDKRGRICATTGIERYLRTDSPYKKDDIVTGTVYLIKRELGVFVAVDNQYTGMIPPHEYFRRIYPGDRLTLRVVSVKEDGRLDLSPRQKAYREIDQDAELILKAIILNDGFLPFHDHSHPAAIKKHFQISKKAFKRAVGRLMKQGKIEQTEEGLRLLASPKSTPRTARQRQKNERPQQREKGKTHRLFRGFKPKRKPKT